MTESEQIVYISCVEEVRYSFVSHLSEALRRKGIHDVFVDSDDLLSNESQSKVERARVSVMVLPGNHTVSLDKLAEVLECQKNKDQVVIPVLYGVRSLEIEWLIALDSKGFSSVHYSRKECSDSQLVKEIVRDVYEKLFYMGRIGIYSKLLEIEKLVCKQLLNIRCVGIWGMPGIGKTTLAKAVFDQMSGEFDAYCFIEDYTKAIQEKGLYRLLEEQFLKEKAVAGGTNTKLTLLRDKLNNKRVLVVLDDVCNPLVVESFLGGFDWFGPKSLIIITSRDKQVFRLCRVNQIYEVLGLNEKEALQLFSLCASIDEMAEQNLHEVSMKVIKYANGHPLALNFYGRELKGKKRPPEMETAFLELKERPPTKFVDAIKSSYETLNDSCRNIFLDIACFFKGENVDYVIQLLEGCGFFPHVGIDILVEKCLVTVSENRVCMHNLIQDVGRKIINRETTQIGRRSRLWEPWSIKYLLEDDEHNADVEPKTTFRRVQGTEEVEGMFLDTSNLSFDIKPATFDNMLNLRLLKIYCSDPEIYPVISFPDGYIRSLPNELRLLHWENYPLQFLPVNFDPMHLVEINMPYSQLCRLWDGTKNLKMLRTIRLCHSQQLVEIDDLSKAPNLEVIDLQGCTRLQSFPAIGQLLHLRVVNLSGCTEIKSFPEIPPNIETLHLQGTGITEVPLSIVKPNYRELLNLLAEIPGLSGVSNLEQSDLKPLTSLMKIGTSDKNLGKLIRLELKDCSRLRSLPDMDNLELIKVLDLSGCLELETIQGFPRNLKELYLASTAVRRVPQLPQSLEIFNAHGCVSLKSIRLNFEKLPVHYTFSNCFDLSPQVINDFLVKVLANAQYIPRERQQELNKSPACFCAPSHVNQNSTLDLQPGSSVMTRLNPSWRNTLVGFAMLVEVAFSEDYCDATGFGIRCVCRWKNKEGHSRMIERNLHCWALGKAVQKNHMFVFVDVNMRPSTDEGNKPLIWYDLVLFEFFPFNQQTKPLDNSCTVTRCGVRVITAATCDTSLENVSPVWSSDPMDFSGSEVEEVLRVSYDGLQEIEKALFLYMACLFNDEDAGLVAPHIANIIDMDVSYGLKVLADRSLIRVSSNGEIVMHCLIRQMAKEIIRTEPMQPGSSKKIKRLVENSQSSMMNARKIEITHSENPENWTMGSFYVPTTSHMDASSSCVGKLTPTGPQVFISFNGKDVRRHFVSFIDHALRKANINVFTDEDEFLDSDLVHLLKRIEESEIALVIFSEDFTSSPWCLDELAKIKECKDQCLLVVIPIFYKVQPYAVKYLKGQYGDNFRDLKHKHLHQPLRTQKWEEALVSIPGTMPLAEQRTRRRNNLLKLLKIGMPLAERRISRNNLQHLLRIQKWEEALTSIPPTVLGMKLSEKSDQSDREFIESIVDKVKSLLDDIVMGKDVDQKRQEVNSHEVITNEDIRRALRQILAMPGSPTVEEGPPQHQVFINFRGAGLRNGFVSHLVKALQSNDINVFIDNHEDRGVPIEILMERIEKSRIAVVIFSGRYTESIWCLRELAKIKDLMDKGILKVIPIFYKVEPSTVRYLKGGFGDEFRAKDDERKKKWKKALKAIADLMGTMVDEKSDESEIIKNIVENVKKALIKIPWEGSQIASVDLSPNSDTQTSSEEKKHKSFGNELRLKELEEKLDPIHKETRIIGVVGMPGIGKTTLLKELFQKWQNKFAMSALIDQIYGKSNRSEEFDILPKLLVRELLGLNESTLEDDENPYETYKGKLLQGRVLVILDDVSKSEQIDALLGRRDWISEGSRIVIATNDMFLLKDRVTDTYVVPKLNHQDGLKLFQYHAFDEANPPEDFMQLSKEFVHFSRGLPLALEILGKELNGKEKPQWEEKRKLLADSPSP